MTFLSRVFERPQAPAVLVDQRSMEDPNVALTPNEISSLFTRPNVDSGTIVNEKTSLRISTVWRCVNILANAAASLPLEAYQRDSFVAQDHPFLLAPHVELTPFEFWRLTYVHRLLWGNFYGFKRYDGAMKIRHVDPIDPATVTVSRGAAGVKIFKVQQSNGETKTFSSDEIFHLPGLGYDGVVGLSPVQMAAQAMGLSMAAERHGAKLFGNGTLLSGVLSTEQRLTPQQADQTKARWRAKMSGPDAAHDVAVLDSGAKFMPISMPSKDAQFIESRGFQTNELCRWYGVPPYMVGDVEKSTSWGTGIEQQGIGFVVYTLRPDWLVPTEQRVTRELLQNKNVYARYDVEGLLRGDSKARAEFYSTMRNIGVYSVNEIRAIEKLAPVEGGDTRMQPMNMAPLGTPAPAPAPAPAAPSNDDDEPQEGE